MTEGFFWGLFLKIIFSTVVTSYEPSIRIERVLCLMIVSHFSGKGLW